MTTKEIMEEEIGSLIAVGCGIHQEHCIGGDCVTMLEEQETIAYLKKSMIRIVEAALGEVNFTSESFDRQLDRDEIEGFYLATLGLRERIQSIITSIKE